MKLTFKLVAALDVTTFEESINAHLARGYKFIADQPITVIPHENISGHGYQYCVGMLLEETE